MWKEICRGKTKTIVDFGNPTDVFVMSRDDITAGDGEKHDKLQDKAQFSTQTTCNVFQHLERNGVNTHYVARSDKVTFRARRVLMLPVEFIVRRIATGSFLKRNPEIQDGTIFEDLVFEIFEKDDSLHDPQLLFDFDSNMVGRYWQDRPNQDGLIDEKMLIDSRFAQFTPELLQRIKDISLKAFLILEKAWADLGGKLYDFKIEFGYDSSTGDLLLADVIDSDSWRLRFNGEQKDKQSYRDGSKTLQQIGKDYKYVAELSDNFARDQFLFLPVKIKGDKQI